MTLAQKRLDAAGRPQRPAQRASRPSPERAAIDATDLSGGDMVTAVHNDAELRQRAWDAAASVVDPEIPVLTIADLGVLRDVAVTDGRVEVAITPTYSGCPAMNMIAARDRAGAGARGLSQLKSSHRAVAGLDHRLDERGRPPQAQGVWHRTAAGGQRPPCAVRRCKQVACPQCGSANTEVLSEFGSTSCKALWRCKSCREPFDYFKCH